LLYTEAYIVPHPYGYIYKAWRTLQMFQMGNSVNGRPRQRSFANTYIQKWYRFWSVGIVGCITYRLIGKDFHIVRTIQINSGVHAVSYSSGTCALF
jgi:hypothetical protein